MVGSRNGPKHRGEDGYYDEHNHWWPRTPLLPDEERTYPETVPLSYLSEHRLECGCRPCTEYPSQVALRRAKLRCAARRRQ